MLEWSPKYLKKFTNWRRMRWVGVLHPYLVFLGLILQNPARGIYTKWFNFGLIWPLEHPNPSTGFFGWSLLAWVEGPCEGLEDFNPQQSMALLMVTSEIRSCIEPRPRVGGGSSFCFPFIVITTSTIVAVWPAAVLSCSLLQPGAYCPQCPWTALWETGWSLTDCQDRCCSEE